MTVLLIGLAIFFGLALIGFVIQAAFKMLPYILALLAILAIPACVIISLL